MKIIALGHRRGVGKDTAAECLIKQGWIQISFAGPLKETMSKLYNIPLKYFTEQEYKEKELYYWNKTPRELLIWFGSEVIRKNDPEHWIKALHLRLLNELLGASSNINDALGEEIKWAKENKINYIEETVYCPKGFVITDLRFPNEMQYLKSIGAITVKVTREGIIEHNDIADSSLKNHTFDFEIKNNGTKEELWDSLNAIANEVSNVTQLPIEFPVNKL